MILYEGQNNILEKGRILNEKQNFKIQIIIIKIIKLIKIIIIMKTKIKIMII